jgi:diguanylate cyclase (GGDEF)-like protein
MNSSDDRHGIDATALLSAVAAGAEDLVNGQGWPRGVDTLLAELGRVTGVSRVWIFQTIRLTETSVTQDYIFEWASARRYVQIGMPQFSMFSSSLELPEYRAVVKGRTEGRPYKTLPHAMENSWLRETLVQQGIHSMLTIPIMVEGAWWGTLGFDDCEREYDWSETEIALLKTAAQLIASAVIRQRLSERLQQFDILKVLTDSAAWSCDLRTSRVWYTTELTAPDATGTVSCNIRGALALLTPEHARAVVARARELAESYTTSFRMDVQLRAPKGNGRWVELIGNVARDREGKPTHLSGIAVDIRTRKARETRLLEQAETDALTGCRNRHVFEKTLRELFDSSRRSGSDLSLLMVDIDHFKQVNDTHGHPVGDSVIRHLAGLMSKICRRQDLLARVGGEEFAVLMPDTDINEAATAAERLRSTVEASEIPYEEGSLHITVSIGFASLSILDEMDSTTLFHKADKALYAAKNEGRNRIRRAR